MFLNLVLECLTLSFDLVGCFVLLSCIHFERSLELLVLGTQTLDLTLVITHQFLSLTLKFLLLGSQLGSFLSGLGRAADQLLLKPLVLIASFLVLVVCFALLSHQSLRLFNQIVLCLFTVRHHARQKFLLLFLGLLLDLLDIYISLADALFKMVQF